MHGGFYTINHSEMHSLDSSMTLQTISWSCPPMTFCTLLPLVFSRGARDVELFDQYPESDFVRIHGSQSARWSFIPAASNVTHSVIVQPRLSGNYNFTSATVTYKSDDSDMKVSVSLYHVAAFSLRIRVLDSDCLLTRRLIVRIPSVPTPLTYLATGVTEKYRVHQRVGYHALVRLFIFF